MALSLDGAELRRAQVRLGPRLRTAQTLEACGRAVCDVFHPGVLAEGTAADESRCALVRCFATRIYAKLEPALQQRCLQMLRSDTPVVPDMPCFVLLASAGDRPEWCSRHTAGRHRVLPLPSEAALVRLPMVAELFRRFDVRLSDIRPDGGGLMTHAPHVFDMFLVENAIDNPIVPDQDGFVRPFGIRSVLGFGCAGREGDLFVTLLFSKVPLGSDAARRARALALDVAAGVFRIGPEAVFESGQ